MVVEKLKSSEMKAVMGPVGRSTSSGWHPTSAWTIPAIEFISRNSVTPKYDEPDCDGRGFGLVWFSLVWFSLVWFYLFWFNCWFVAVGW